MILEISEETVIRTNPNATEETYFATAATGGTCVGYCCTSSSHNGKPPAQ